MSAVVELVRCPYAHVVAFALFVFNVLVPLVERFLWAVVPG